MQKLSILQTTQLNPLVLAYVGDGVFSLFVRAKLVCSSDCKAGSLNIKCNNYVNATAQSKILDAILPSLSQSEIDIVKRARNSHSNNKAKNASLADYKRATGLEGLIGYLYLSQQDARLQEILEMCMNVI